MFSSFYSQANMKIERTSDFPNIASPVFDLMAKKMEEHSGIKPKLFDPSLTKASLPIVSVEDAIKELAELEKNQNSANSNVPPPNLKELFGI